MSRIVTVHCLAAVLLGIGARATAQQILPIDQYVATVNDRVITASDVLAIVQPLQLELQKTLNGDELVQESEALYTKTLERLIDRALILEEFEKADHGLPAPVVDGRIQEIIRTQFNNNEAEFLNALKAENRTLAEFRDQMRDDLTVMSLRREMVKQFASVSLADIKAEYEKQKDRYFSPEKLRLRMILIVVDGDAEKRNLIEEILAQLNRGENFAQLAREHTEGPKADAGGDLGWIATSDLREEFKTALAAMQPGDISGIIELDDNLAILKFEDHQDARTTPLSEVQKEIERKLEIDAEKTIYDAWIERLRKKHHVVRF